MSTTDPNQQPHLLSLKVMRLSRPSFTKRIPLYHENDETLVGDAALDLMAANDITRLDRIPDFGLTDLLALPASFGNIYLGETFSSYLCINNESQLPVQEVGIKAELQTTSQRFMLVDTIGIGAGSAPASRTSPAQSTTSLASVSASGSNRVSLLPTQSITHITHHEIKELGAHILVCSIHYSHHGQRRHFRKFYKFNVLNPLAVKTKVNTVIDGRVFLEAQITNLMTEGMWLEKVRFEAAEGFTFQDLNVNVGLHDTALDAATGQGAERGPLLAPQETIQTLYVLTPKPVSGVFSPTGPLVESVADPSTAETTPIRALLSPHLGHLSLSWQTPLSSGRLQTSQLSRKPLPLRPVTVLLSQVPSCIAIETPFLITLRVRNNTQERLEAHVGIEGLLVFGAAKWQCEVDNAGWCEKVLKCLCVQGGNVGIRCTISCRGDEWVEDVGEVYAEQPNARASHAYGGVPEGGLI
ncbi:hypothetical protein HDU85_002738 [Gaertneriomyces sp. JEL0708]|nr:hypothetical protein HDU85_002738 [Gaertneriomyces sp. JEL0708]